jgi:hypothetical protein
MCERVALPGGGFAIVCGGHRRSTKKCAYPDCRASVSVECDHQDAAGKTCDRGTCRAHAKPIGADVDWCWLCAREEAKRGNSPRLAL